MLLPVPESIYPWVMMILMAFPPVSISRDHARIAEGNTESSPGPVAGAPRRTRREFTCARRSSSDAREPTQEGGETFAQPDTREQSVRVPGIPDQEEVMLTTHIALVAEGDTVSAR